MTNVEIISMAMAMNGVSEDVDTYAGWKRRGMQVQKGQKALFQTRIWKPVKGKKVSAKKKGTDADSKAKAEAVDEGEHLIMVNASYFGASQVE